MTSRVYTVDTKHKPPQPHRTPSARREQDDQIALKMETKTSLSRWAKRDAQREARRLQLEAEYGEDAMMYA